MNTSGQSLVEFMLGAAVSAMMIGGAALLLQTQWERVICAHRVFEATHARLINHPSANRTIFGLAGHSIHFTETPLSIQSDGRCGRIHEKVELFKLEAE